MKKNLFLTFALLCAVVQGAWATDYNVSTDSELRAAIQNNGANITVTADIDLSNSTLSIESNKTVTIDLGGHTLDRKLTKRGDNGGQVITVREGATLNLSNGTLTGAWGRGGGGLVNENGTAHLTDVIITGNVAEDRGGGIYNYGTLTMTGGAITNNISQDLTAPTGGGGIFNAEGAMMTLTNVTISGNKAKVTGGGGICNFGTLTLDGCTITDNSANTSGGAIWQEGTLNMQGANVITGNTDASGLANNVYLKNGKVITVNGSLAGSSVGITMQTPGTFTTGFAANNSGVDPATIFTPDLSGAMAVSLDGNEAKLANSLPAGSVYYIERSWDEENKCVKAEVKTLASGSYTVLQGSDDPVTIQPGYYVVKGDIECERVYCAGVGKHHLILCDGASLSTYFVRVEGDNELYIYGQTNDSGKLVVEGEEYTGYHAGIGGDRKNTVGTIVIHGGDINSTGSVGGSGIGCGLEGHDATIVIYGGNIYAQGEDTFVTDSQGDGPAGAGIGGGDMKNGSVTIYGGHIEALAGGIIYGGGAGIGSGHDSESILNGGVITIYGGDISATGGNGGAGIGSGQDCSGAYVTIHGGVVKAQGCGNGAGIGTGYNYHYKQIFTGELTVTGGEVYAYGSEHITRPEGGGAGIGGGRNGDGSKVTISGGYVYAQGGKYAAGIGSGCEGLQNGGKHGGSLTVTGGHVEAYGGVDAAGIGGGEDADGGTVTITGGYVYAEGNDGAAGIGGGEEGDGGTFTISGGEVHATAGIDGAGIGGGWGGAGGTVTVNGGKVYARANVGDYANGAGIGSGTEQTTQFGLQSGTFTMTDGYVEAYGGVDAAGIGGGEGADCGDITITGGTVIAKSGTLTAGYSAIGPGESGTIEGTLSIGDKLMVSYGLNPETTYYAPSSQRATYCSSHPYVKIKVCTHPGASPSIIDGISHNTGCDLCTIATEAHTFGSYGECPVCHLISLADDADNSETINHWNNTAKSVVLTGRTLYKDGMWNTLTLPFAVDMTADGCPLNAAGVEARTLTEASIEGTTLNLTFGDAVTTLTAGVPYIIKWTKDDENPTIDDPVFSGVTVDNTNRDVTFTGGSFKGTYSPMSWDDEDRSFLFLGEDNNLHWPLAGANINACRAYFQLNGAQASEFVLNFGEEETSISPAEIKEITEKAGAWYTINGVRLSGKPTKKGLYIHNGRKVVIK